MSAFDAPLETVLRRDRIVVVAVLVAVSALAWAWLLTGAGMEIGAATDMARAHGSDGNAPLLFAMWWMMMLAMMLPSASPMILLFAAVNRKQKQRGGTYVPTAVFAAGYLLVWAGFSAGAVVLQLALQHSGLLSPMLASTSRVLGGLMLVAAGLYQLTPLKHVCLRHCRAPVHFLAEHWRPGSGGALRMGMIHGAYCVGCCWFLMLLLFVGGVMNLAWIVGLALLVLLEKTMPAGQWLARAVGLILLLAGGWALFGAAPGGDHAM